MKTKKKEMIEKTILMVPLLVAFLGLANAVVFPGSTSGNLAPGMLNNLVNVLFAFIIIYAIVLGYLFIKMNKEYKTLAVKTKAPIKRTVKKKTPVKKKKKR